jgi:cysteine desulfurase
VTITASRASDAAVVRRAYLDHASTSPLRPAAFEAMLPFLRDHHADPGRLHSEGRVTRVALEEAREQVAALLAARPREVIFTASGTEAVNTAVWGAVARAGAPAHVVTTAVEHSAVLDACNRSGADVAVVGVDRLGRFDPAEVLAAVRANTALVTVQLANHEVGTVQPVAEVAAACRERGVLVHVDACMAAGHIPVDFGVLGTDLCSVSAHKFGGPKGAGALLVRRGLRLPPFVVGGAQERARRGGLEDVPAMVGFGAAAGELLADEQLNAEARTQRELTDRVAREAPERVGGVVRYGDPVDRVPQLVCFGVEGVEAEPILLGLDQRGVAVHSGSACSSEALEPSPILAAMGVDADHSLRVSVGWSTAPEDIDTFLDTFPAVVDRLRALRAG